MHFNRKTSATLAATLLCAAATMPFAATAAPETAAPAVSAPAVSPDSCAAAFATVMAQYLKPEINKQFPADTAAITEFIRGVAHAFDIKNVDAPYYMGVRNGFAMIDRLESMQQMGFPITTGDFCSQLDSALRSSAMGFTPETADAFLRDAMAAMYPEPEVTPLSPESQQAFIDSKKTREGVIQTPSGLLFEVITEGEGSSPADTDQVKVIYTGRLADGTVFDTTERPIQFPVNRLVPGFTEGLKMMKPGGEYRLYLPPALGYGDRGAGGVIPPGAALDFTVRLLEIIPAGTPGTLSAQ